MLIYVIEGQAWVEAQGGLVYAPAGTLVRVPLNGNGVAAGAPIGPLPYVTANLAALPIRILEQPITVAPSLTPAQITALSDPLLPSEGTWDFALVSTDCEGASVENTEFEVTVEDDGALFNLGAIPYTRTAPGVYGYGYTGQTGIVYNGTMQVLNPATMQLDWHVAFTDGTSCDSQSSITLRT
jgi:hypothetical protein